ncbi:MAG: DinB family protein [Thermoflexales bacterium]|nr:DinB family protein [Thermoflexales bacterium]
MLTHAERHRKIESYGQAHQILTAALAQFPREMWQYRAAPDRWTIHEVIVHITDSEANSYIRGRRFIAEPGTQIAAYDEMRWATALRYHDQSTEAALELFKWLRSNTYELIKSLPAEVWAHIAEHSEAGPMTMDDWLDTYERHIPDHIAQMQAVYEAWESERTLFDRCC